MRRKRNELLITLVARYVAGTETFMHVPNGIANVQFIILVYRPKGLDDPDGVLRPFAVVARDTQGLLQPRELKEISQRVIEQDRAARPDWFPLATVLPIADGSGVAREEVAASGAAPSPGVQKMPCTSNRSRTYSY